MNYTPGPWEADTNRNHVVDTRGLTVAAISPGAARSAEQRDANARLIAAAPELVEACWDAISQIEYLHEKFSPTRSGEAVLSRLRAAIAKAGAECQ